MSEMFEAVKEQLNIAEVAERYGLRVGCNNKALCPFHNDTHPSLSFKNDYFKCFSCGAGGDAITLVCKLTNCKPIEAARQLNEMFGLNLNMEKCDMKRLTKIRNDSMKAEAFKQWADRAFFSINEYARLLERIIKENSPKNFGEPMNKSYVKATGQIERIKHFLDILTICSWQDKIDLYKTCKREVEEIERYVNGRNVG